MAYRPVDRRYEEADKNAINQNHPQDEFDDAEETDSQH